MEILHRIIANLDEGSILQVSIGLFFTAVVVETKGKRRCGLAATLSDPIFEHARTVVVKEAGRIEQHSVSEVAHWVFSTSPTEVSVGLATINALLPELENPKELNAEDYIVRYGVDQQVAVIGHFPFVAGLKSRVKKLWVLELNPREDDLPASAAAEIIPQADILAITATTLINHTLAGLLALRKPGAKVLLLGPSTPLSPLLFEIGVNVLSGSIVDKPDEVSGLVRQGATFRQIHPHGVRLVTLETDGL